MAEIRPFRSADAAAVAEILNESILARDSLMVLNPLSVTDILRQHDALGAREALVVLCEDEVVVGWGIVKRYSDREGYRRTCETSVYLRRERTNRGLGTRLQLHLLQRCRDLDYHHVVVRIVADNARSIRMHEKLGFEMVGIQREAGIVDGTWQDIAIMQCIVDDTSV